MDISTKIDCSSCKSCLSANTDSERSFVSQRFDPWDKIRFSPEAGHILFIMEGELEIMDNDEVHICKANEMALLAYNKEYKVMVENTVKLIH